MTTLQTFSKMPHKQRLSASNSSSLTKENKSLSKPYTCKICGDRARGTNYGVISCLSCKVFFRRNGFHPEIAHQCLYNSQCQINISTRRLCIPCRLAKCFSIGMDPYLIRKEDCRKKNSSTTKSNTTQISKCQAMPQLPTLSLLYNDKSLLTTSQWTLFSNVLHAYDRFSPIPMFNNFLNKISLSSYETQFDVGDILKTASSAFTSLQSFISSTPDFQVLSSNEQQSLIKRNLNGMGPFAASIAFRDTNFTHHPKCRNGFVMVYGREMEIQIERILNQLDIDSTLLIFITLIISFSSNCFVVDIDKDLYYDSFLFGTFRLYGSQNVYVEVLWKYMLYRYGYYETIRRFSGIIKCVLDKIKQTSMVYLSNKSHNNFINSVVQQTKRSLVISQNETVSLWGKTLQSN